MHPGISMFYILLLLSPGNPREEIGPDSRFEDKSPLAELNWLSFACYSLRPEKEPPLLSILALLYVPVKRSLIELD
ncbi:hypothetical protein Lal_00042297 [Lupinus albus]|nr:hypothetical protein Lal_00042297 [Lupinus albus]